MKSSDFDNIDFFTQKEVKATGAKIADVKVSLMYAMSEFRRLLGVKVHLQVNGLTSGNHVAQEHKDGTACDWYPEDPVDLFMVLRLGLQAGFRGIGFYWNGLMHSYHFDKRPDIIFWTARKKLNDKAWEYGKFFVPDPAKIFQK